MICATATAFDRLGGAIFQRWGRLDYLAHVAAHGGMLSPAAQLAPKDAAAYSEVNFLATLRLIRSLDPLFQLAEAPGAAFVVHRVAGRANWSGYGASKAAGEAVARSYAEEATNARVLLFEPQPMATALRSKNLSRPEPRGSWRGRKTRRRGWLRILFGAHGGAYRAFDAFDFERFPTLVSPLPALRRRRWRDR